MELEWGEVAAIAAAVLVFLASAWRILEERSTIRRLERLALVRTTIENGSAASDIDEAIELLAARVLKRETPMKKRTRALVAGLALALSGFATAVTFATLYEGAPEDATASPWFWLMILLISAGYTMVIGAFMAPLFRFSGTVIEGLIEGISAFVDGFPRAIVHMVDGLAKWVSRLGR